MTCIGPHLDTPPDADTGFLCYRCHGRLRRNLLDLPAVATWLEVNVAAGRGGAERVSGTRDDPIPLRVDILDLIGPVAPTPTLAVIHDLDHQLGDPSMYDEMRSWASLVEEETGDPWEDRRTLTGAVSYLTAHLTWLAHQPWVDELIGKTADLTRRAHRVAPWRAETRRDDEPCPSCNVRALIVHVAEEQVRCERRLGGCGRTAPATAWAGLRRKEAG